MAHGGPGSPKGHDKFVGAVARAAKAVARGMTEHNIGPDTYTIRRQIDKGKAKPIGLRNTGGGVR